MRYSKNSKSFLLNLGITINIITLILLIMAIIIFQFETPTSSFEEEQTPEFHAYSTHLLPNDMGQYFDNQSIQMVYGYGYEDYGSILDETGRIWYWNYFIPYGEKVLLWFVDSGTPDNYEDDIIIKVWRESKLQEMPSLLLQYSKSNGAIL